MEPRRLVVIPGKIPGTGRSTIASRAMGSDRIAPEGPTMWLVFSGNNIGPRDDPSRRIQHRLLVRRAWLELHGAGPGP
jgi:hypothetical protein